ncbi:IclR family transcriptional regulator domain-containing protein [Nesterenkonia sandarakina]|uniref:IclR family pca regulon transcriptional regulator n=1 Tax=Nesterenkonia sandarakina TaxID=272918 RepID=A0A7Z0E7F4_9MICC|nr:IclR family transcriptional regulator C-terminal domain-containing protein [Nesterenkonia sandarakina]NYJ16288.1 IclR family pca regulon transcriptional regulator [Nesterenkonia sandarakina]
MSPERSPEFIEAISRGLSVIKAFTPEYPILTLSQVAKATDLARPTARRILMTLQELEYVRAENGAFALTPRVMELGMAYVSSLGLWEVARPHLEALVTHTHESASMSQLDGPDIVYVARVAVPKLIGLRVDIGTRFPAPPTSQGKVLLADMERREILQRLSEASRSSVIPVVQWDQKSFLEELDRVKQQGYALADEELARGIRSVAVPVRDAQGRVLASMNTTVHAAETSVETLLNKHLPPLREAAAAVTEDWTRWQSLPSQVRERDPADVGRIPLLVSPEE